MNVVAVAAGIGDVPLAVLQSGGPSVCFADSLVLWSCHLLLRGCHGDDGNYRETDLVPVCSSQFYVL